MTFSPKKFLNLANELKESFAKDDLVEARLRTSIGRSYYAVFLLVRQKIEDTKGSLLPKKDIHQKIIDTMKDSTNNNLAGFGTNMDILRGYRNQADYDVSMEIIKTPADRAYRLSDKLFNDLPTLPEPELASLPIS